MFVDCLRFVEKPDAKLNGGHTTKILKRNLLKLPGKVVVFRVSTKATMANYSQKKLNFLWGKPQTLQISPVNRHYVVLILQ